MWVLSKGGLPSTSGKHDTQHLNLIENSQNVIYYRDSLNTSAGQHLREDPLEKQATIGRGYNKIKRLTDQG